MAQHDQIRALFTEVEQAVGDDRRESFRHLVRLLAVHETAEEEVVHPYARKNLSGGERMVQERLTEERTAKQALSELDSMGTEHPDFPSKLAALRDDVLHHADAEEREEFDQLRQHTDAEKLATMAKAVKAAEATAPTRPHPGVESQAQNATVGPLAALMDRSRDAARKVMGKHD